MNIAFKVAAYKLNIAFKGLTSKNLMFMGFFLHKLKKLLLRQYRLEKHSEKEVKILIQKTTTEHLSFLILLKIFLPGIFSGRRDF